MTLKFKKLSLSTLIFESEKLPKQIIEGKIIFFNLQNKLHNKSVFFFYFHFQIQSFVITLVFVFRPEWHQEATKGERTAQEGNMEFEGRVRQTRGDTEEAEEQPRGERRSRGIYIYICISIFRVYLTYHRHHRQSWLTLLISGCILDVLFNSSDWFDTTRGSRLKFSINSVRYSSCKRSYLLSY